MSQIRSLTKNYKYLLRESFGSEDSTANTETITQNNETAIIKQPEAGLSDYEKNHNSTQKTALIERVKTLRSIKNDPDAAFSNLQQMQLDVAEKLLGPQNLTAEFDSVQSSSEIIADTALEELKKGTKTREERILNAANRAAGWNKFLPSSTVESMVGQIQNGGIAEGGSKIRAEGSQDKYDKMIYDQKSDLETFSFDRNRDIKENQGSITMWADALTKYNAESERIGNQINGLQVKKDLIKDGFKVWERAGNEKKRIELQKQIDELIPTFNSSNANIDKANSRINSLKIEIAKSNNEISEYKKVLDKKYTM